MKTPTVGGTAALALGAPLLAMLALGACRKEPPAPSETPQAVVEAPAEPVAPASTAPVEPQKIPGTDAIAVSQNTSADAKVQARPTMIAGVEPRDFAGDFAATDTELRLQGDGTYAMQSGAPGAGGPESTGTWTVEAGGKALLLDSNDKAEADRRFDVVSKDELKASGGGQVLRRKGAA